MKIVIVGDGKVGRTITKHLTQEGHEVVVIDKVQDNIEDVIESFDVMGICGNGASYDIQQEAGVEDADIFIAATSLDEINIFSSILAKKLGAKDTIARVRSPEYRSQIQFMKDEMGISLSINPEYETAIEITDMLDLPGAIKVEKFAGGKVELIESIIGPNNPLVGKNLQQIKETYGINILVCAVERDGNVHIPSGNFTLLANDKIHIAASRKNILSFFEAIGLTRTKKNNNVMIIGAGKIAYYLLERLLSYKYNVKVIEKDEKRCLELSQLFPKATIINDDGTNQEILEQEGINEVGALVSLTNIDEENIVIGMYAQNLNVEKIILKVNRKPLANILKSINMANVISPKDVTANRVLSYVRAKSNDRGSKVVALYKLVNEQVEALQFEITEKSKLIDVPLKDLKLIDDTLITSIIRNNEVIIPNGFSEIKLNDTVLVITKEHNIDVIEEILR